MSTYERKKTADVSSDKLYLADRSIYGSGRLGLEDVNLLMEYTDPLAVVTDMEELVSQKFNAGETSLGALWTRQANCGTSAVMSNVSGALQVTDICSVQYDRLFTTEIGRTYEFHADFDVSSAENLLISFHAHATGCGTSLLDQNLSVSTGHFSYSFTAISTCSRITIHNNGHSNNGGTFKIDNISFLRKIVNHQEVANKVGDKQYELANHLGNVLNVVTDRKLPFVYDSNTIGLVDYFMADVKSYSDYYPFGMQLPKRHGREGIEDYRYGFNGKEKDNELKLGDGNSYNFGARMYDPRIGRWLSRDPLFKYYPDFSEYNYCINNPIIIVDADGRVLRDKNGNIIYSKIPGEKPETTPWKGNRLINVTYERVYIYSDLGEKIEVDLVTIAIDRISEEKIKETSKEWQFYNCHGQSSLNKQFLVGSTPENSNEILLDKMGKENVEPEKLEGLVSTDFSKIKKGDIIVYFDEDGTAIHSARFQGKDASEDKVESKNGFKDLGTYTESEVHNEYIVLYEERGWGKVTHGYFTPQEDTKIDVQGKVNSNRGIVEVSEADVQKALNP